eukprot:9483144-Pyramimonas_sp.AAC.1
MIHELSNWSEGCPCHEALFVHKTRWFNEKAYNEEIRSGNPSAHSCPNKGNRAPELAAGRAKRVFDQIAAKSLIIRLRQLRRSEAIPFPGPLPRYIQRGAGASFLANLGLFGGSSVFARDLCSKGCSDIARAHAWSVLEVKLTFWRVIPWRLCALAHSDPTVVRECARDVSQQWDRRPDPQLHHRVSVRFLQPEETLLAGWGSAGTSGIVENSLNDLSIAVGREDSSRKGEAKEDM